MLISPLPPLPTALDIYLPQQHAQLLLALVAIAHAQWREALQLLGGVVATPTGLYNHCLLQVQYIVAPPLLYIIYCWQCHVGVVMGGASGWVKERRGRVPVGKAEARQWLQDSRKLLQEHRTRYIASTEIFYSSMLYNAVGPKKVMRCSWLQWMLPCWVCG